MSESSEKDNPDLMLLCGAAKLLGFRNALSLRRFCRRIKVQIYKTGRMEWVSPSEITTAVKSRGSTKQDQVEVDVLSLVKSLKGAR